MKTKPYMTLTEAAEYLDVSRQRVHAIIKDGRLEVVNKIGGHKMILLDRAQVERFKRERDKRGKK
ncbi:helix-turn-helix domain-containing protein [Nitrospinae bacterium AH_259_B05_G02_I21]|nr:helix-turn-helix domain-containing protein [Nitrospinae bacterium AH_259_B05_G02_I21]MDA2932573.1 helix-turn-helix domain-containing protein [Nitrospinae bacterium AH-259-F20]